MQEPKPSGSILLKRDLWLVTFSLGISAVFILLGQWSDPHAAIVDQFHRGDSWWYEGIAEKGYPMIAPGGDLGHWHGSDLYQTPWGFFPLYPWMVRSTALLSGLSPRHAMFLFAWLLSIVLPVVAHRTFNALSDAGSALWGALVMFAFPFSIYFHLHMSEGLYALLLMGSFLAVSRRSSSWLMISSSLMVLARPNGLVMLLPLALFICEREGITFRSFWHERVRVIKALLPLAAGALAFAAYGVYQWRMTGTPFAFSKAEEGWGRHLTWPFMGFFNGGDIATQFESWYTIVLIIASAFLTRKLPLSLALLIWIGILFPLCSGTVSDMMRYTSVMFPFFLLSGTWLEISRWRVAVIASALVLQFAWFWLWLQGGLLAC